MNKRGSDDGGGGEIDGVSDTAEITNTIATRTWKGGDLLREREIGVKDEAVVFAEGVCKIGCAVGKEREGLIILDVGWGKPEKKISFGWI